MTTLNPKIGTRSDAVASLAALLSKDRSAAPGRQPATLESFDVLLKQQLDRRPHAERGRPNAVGSSRPDRASAEGTTHRQVDRASSNDTGPAARTRLERRNAEPMRERGPATADRRERRGIDADAGGNTIDEAEATDETEEQTKVPDREATERKDEPAGTDVVIAPGPQGARLVGSEPDAESPGTVGATTAATAGHPVASGVTLADAAGSADRSDASNETALDGSKATADSANALVDRDAASVEASATELGTAELDVDGAGLRGVAQRSVEGRDAGTGQEARSIEADGDLADGAPSHEVMPDDVSADGAPSHEVMPDDVSADDVSSHEVMPDDVSADDVSADDGATPTQTEAMQNDEIDGARTPGTQAEDTQAGEGEANSTAEQTSADADSGSQEQTSPQRSNADGDQSSAAAESGPPANEPLVEPEVARPSERAGSTSTQAAAGDAASGQRVDGASPAQVASRTDAGATTASTTSPATTRTMSFDGDVGEQVRQAVNLVRQSGPGRHEVSLLLRPDDLGAVSVELVQNGDEVTVRIVTQTTAAQERLDRGRLLADLQSAGLDPASVDIEHRDPNDSNGGSAGNERNQTPFGTGMATIDPTEQGDMPAPTSGGATSAHGGIDLAL